MDDQFIWLYSEIAIKKFNATYRIIDTANIYESEVPPDLFNKHEKGYLLEPNCEYLIISKEKRINIVRGITVGSDTDLAISEEFYVYKKTGGANFLNDYGVHVVRNLLSNEQIINRELIASIKFPNLNKSGQLKELEYHNTTIPESYESVIDKFLHEYKKVLSRLEDYLIDFDSHNKSFYYQKLLDLEGNHEVSDYLEEYKDKHEDIFRSIQSLKTLSKSLSKVNFRNAKSLELSRSNLNDFLTSNQALKSVNATIRVDPDLELNFDKNYFTMLFDNLVENSKMHSGQESDDLRINVSAAKNGEFCEIRYSDNGNGLSISFEEYITYRAKTNMSSGTGIGGFVIHQIVYSHKGFFSMDNAVKKGFGVLIKIPN